MNYYEVLALIVAYRIAETFIAEVIRQWPNRTKFRRVTR